MAKIILNYETMKPEIEGDFKFTASALYLDPVNSITYKEIRFPLNVELPQHPDAKYTNDELYEMMGEKLKQDFIAFAKSPVS